MKKWVRKQLRERQPTRMYLDRILETILSISLITIGVMVIIFMIRDSINHKDDDTYSEV